MAIQSITNSLPLQQTVKPSEQRTKTPFEAQQSFASMLNQAIKQVDQAQFKSDQMTTKLIKGEDVDLHNVMIAAQKASIALNATVEMRNKVVEAYQEIIRMPV